MKKSLRIASILLVLVLVTSCFVGGTFAKYVTDGSGSDTARVAKFGVKVTNAGTLFLQDYAKQDATYTLSDNTVESFDDWNLVAPGTTNSNTDVVLEGQPEVAVRVNYEITTLNVTGAWEAEGAEYFPIIFTVNEDEYYIGQDGITSIETLVAKVKEAAADYSVDYKPNTDLSTVAADALDISWRWEFESDTLGAYQTDAKDTALGNAAADATEGNELAIELAINTTVTQID